MQLQYVELRLRSQTLLLGPPAAMPNLPVEMRPTAQARQLLHGLRAVPQEVHKLRSFLSRSRISVADPRGLDDHEVVELAEQALEREGLRALILSNSPAAPKLTTGEASMSSSSSKPGQSILGKPAAVKPVGQWPLEDRVTEVIRRASKQIPGEGARALQAMLTPENIALMVTIVAVAAAANLTPAGWIADAGLAALAFYYGGMAAFEAMSDLVACFIITSSAKSERDLDEAARHLAEAVIGMGTVAIIAILHRTAKRGGAAEEAPKPKPVERTPSPAPAPKPVEAAKPKPVEAAKPKPKPKTSTYSRPSGYRKGVRDKVWDDAVKASKDGVVRDPLTGKAMSKSDPWDMGHLTGHEFRRMQAEAAQKGLTRKQFLDLQNDPKIYRPELPSSNRSHKLEDMSDLF